MGERSAIRRLYLAGPMRGLPEFNFPAFFAAAKNLAELGYRVWNPAEADVAAGFDPKSEDEPPSLREFMARDLPGVCESDAVIVLPGWETSTGALIEVAVARALEIPVYTYPDWRSVADKSPAESTSLSLDAKLATFDRYAGEAIDELATWLREGREDLIAVARGRHVEGHFRFGDSNFLEWPDGELDAQTAQEIADAIVYRSRRIKRRKEGGK